MSETEFGWPEGQGPVPHKTSEASLSSTDRALLMRRAGYVGGTVPPHPSDEEIQRWMDGDDPNAAPAS